jgi:hypothetical protein
MTTMECDLCMRPPNSRLPFLCPSCARSILYEPRIRLAKVLLEKEKFGHQIERLSSSTRLIDDKYRALTVPRDAHIDQQWLIESNNIKRAQARDRTRYIQDHTQILRDEIRAAREELAKRKIILQKKKAQASVIRKEIPHRREDHKAQMEENIQKTTRSWDGIHSKQVETRGFLCREAAHLYGLKQRKKMRGGVVRDQYTIGGTPIIDLKDINGAKVNELTTCLVNVSHLVVLVSFYLSLRLPAEITLPHRNHPLPTIFTPANSYQGREAIFPGLTPLSSSTNSPTASRRGTDLKMLPRPRPLFIEPENLKDKIPAVAKRDPTTFSFFLEGIALLAWDIAWLCRSQGVSTGTDSWEDVCNMGRNLWNLLIAPSLSPALPRASLPRDVGQQQHDPSAPRSRASTQSKPLKLGQFSHDSAHPLSIPDPNYYYSNDNGAPSVSTPSVSTPSSIATDFLRGWKVSKHSLLVDPLKRALIGEISNAEWEMLEQDEWADQEIDNIHSNAKTNADSDNANTTNTANSNNKMTPLPVVIDTDADVDTAAQIRPQNPVANAIRRKDPLLEDHGMVHGDDGEVDPIAATTNTVGAAEPTSGEDQATAASASSRTKGTSGWTKLKNREKGAGSG